MADEPDPYDLVPPHLRLKERRALAIEAALLARGYKNGHLRGKSQAGKRQWIHRVCCVLEEISAKYHRSGESASWNQIADNVRAANARERELAAVRGEPMPEEEPLEIPKWQKAFRRDEKV